jgi:hypothetical protein
MDKISDSEMFELLEQVIAKVSAEKTVDKKDYNMVLTVTAVSLARVVEHKYLQIIGGMQNGSDTGEQSQEEGSGDPKTA